MLLLGFSNVGFVDRGRHPRTATNKPLITKVLVDLFDFVSFGRFWVHEPPEQPVEPGSEPPEVLGSAGDFSLLPLHELREAGICDVGLLPREPGEKAGEEEHPHLPHVRADFYRVPLQMHGFPYFWWAGGQRPSPFLDQGIGPPREPEVGQFDLGEVFGEHEHIFRSHVSMNEALAVHEFEGRSYLLHDGLEVNFVQSPQTLDPVPEITVGSQLLGKDVAVHRLEGDVIRVQDIVVRRQEVAVVELDQEVSHWSRRFRDGF